MTHRRQGYDSRTAWPTHLSVERQTTAAERALVDRLTAAGWTVERAVVADDVRIHITREDTTMTFAALTALDALRDAADVLLGGAS